MAWAVGARVDVRSALVATVVSLLYATIVPWDVFVGRYGRDLHVNSAFCAVGEHMQYYGNSNRYICYDTTCSSSLLNRHTACISALLFGVHALGRPPAIFLQAVGGTKVKPAHLFHKIP